MNIIMLSGASDSGKTTTLNMVYDQLVTKLGATITQPKSKLGGDPDDFECTLNYRGKCIAIFTMGDYAYSVMNAMDTYSALKCDVLIIACNNHFVRPYQKIRHFPNIIRNKTMPLSNSSNSSDCTYIVSQL